MELNFETQVALQRIAVPLVLATVGGLLLSRRSAGSGASASAASPAAWSTLLGAMLVAAGPCVSELWKRDLLLQPARWHEWSATEPWMWMVWIVPASVIMVAIWRCAMSSSWTFATWMFPWGVSVAALGLYVCLPQGQGWLDKSSDVVRWLVAATIAFAWNQWGIDTIASSPGGRWAPWVLVAQFGAIAGLALQSYASLGEWALVGVGFSAGLAIAALLSGDTQSMPMGWPAAVGVIPGLWMAVASLAVSQFYITTPPANWLLGLVLFLPTLVALIDLLIKKRSAWVRAIVAAVACGIVIAIAIAITMQSRPEW
ncbi:MAG: hypothetical protein ACK5OB_16640 [Pirellula sp.]